MSSFIFTHNFLHILGYGPVIYTPCRFPFRHKGKVFRKCIKDLQVPGRTLNGTKAKWPECERLIKEKRRRNDEAEKLGEMHKELLRKPFKRFFYFYYNICCTLISGGILFICNVGCILSKMVLASVVYSSKIIMPSLV